jgi:hypothetical protein
LGTNGVPNPPYFSKGGAGGRGIWAPLNHAVPLMKGNTSKPREILHAPGQDAAGALLEIFRFDLQGCVFDAVLFFQHGLDVFKAD